MQCTGCLKIEKKEDLILTYGNSNREGWRVDPINPIDYFDSITDFKLLSKQTLTVKQTDFKKCLTKLGEELGDKKDGRTN